jgi:hypothetical protein
MTESNDWLNMALNQAAADMQPKQCGRHFKPWDNYCPNVGLHSWFNRMLDRPYNTILDYRINQDEYERQQLVNRTKLKAGCDWLDTRDD